MKMNFRFKNATLASLAGALLLAASPVSALEPIRQEAHINNSLRAALVADQIRKTCPTIDARMIKAWRELEKLKSYALKKGYDPQTIEAYVESRDEKRRMRGEAAAWLAGQGARGGDQAAHCAVGRQEIAKGSLIGQLLRDKG